jgi:DedD protein
MNYATDTAPPPDTLDEEALRRRLVNRIAIAGVVVVALLGGLALIDTLYVAPPTPAPKIVPMPAPVEVAKTVDTATSPAPTVSDTAPEPPHPEAVPTIKSQGEPEETSSPSAPLPKATRSVTKPVSGKAAPNTAKTSPPQELAHQEPATIAAHSPPSRPLTQGAQAERRFVLQMGVFNNVDNAQELLGKLQKAGVPAQIEARVQVGPFNTRKEADEARTKIAAMGLDPGLLMATHR